MAVTKVRLGVWHSSLTGDEYDSEMAARHYDDRERQRSQPDSPGTKILEKLSTEELKSLCTEMAIIAGQPAGQMNWQQIQQEFVDTHPDFLACQENGRPLVALLIERGQLTPRGQFSGTMEDIETAYCDLVERNVLLRKKGTPLPKRPFNEKEAYELPADELLKRARGW